MLGQPLRMRIEVTCQGDQKPLFVLAGYHTTSSNLLANLAYLLAAPSNPHKQDIPAGKIFYLKASGPLNELFYCLSSSSKLRAIPFFRAYLLA